MEFDKEIIQATIDNVDCSKEQAIIILNEIQRQKRYERGSIFEKIKVKVLANAFIYLDNYGGEELQMDDIGEWFTEAKSEIIDELNGDAKRGKDDE